MKSLLRSKPLSVQLALASLVSVLALGAVGGVGILSLRQLSATSSSALRAQMELFDNTAGLQALLYQKGFVAYYMLTHDRTWLAQMESSGASFSRWLERARTVGGRLDSDGSDEESQHLLSTIAQEYDELNEARRQIVAAFDAGHTEEATALLARHQGHNERLRILCQEFTQLGHRHAQHELFLSQRSLGQRTALLLLASVAGTLASLAMGFLLARRIDAAILEQRQRLMQNEKLSAIGEVAAKLAHEILNPLAGMKAAAQLLLRAASRSTVTAPTGLNSAATAMVPAAEVHETATALEKEITRVDQLVRRLVNYARPLAPRLETCAISRVLDSASEAVRNELSQNDVRLVREEARDLPTLEIDPLLLTQALVNLISNAAQASPPRGTVIVSASLTSHLGRETLAIQVLDEGAGIASEHQERLFHPFFTTRPKGHGLGLATTQNIVIEHGGQIAARNREGGGALFEILLPTHR